MDEVARAVAQAIVRANRGGAIAITDIISEVSKAASEASGEGRKAEADALFALANALMEEVKRVRGR